MAGRSDAGGDASRQERPSVTVDVVVFGMFGCLDAEPHLITAAQPANGPQPGNLQLLISRNESCCSASSA